MSRVLEEKVNVLIVEDDTDIINLVRHALGNKKYNFAATDSCEAVLTSLDLNIPDLIILDVLLPETDGFEICRRIRNHKSGKYLPVLMMTSLNDNGSINTAYDVGASDFILKPFKPTLLSHQVRFLLHTDKTANELRETQSRLETAQRMAKLGHWEWNFKKNKITWSKEISRITGLRPSANENVSMADILERIHPGDRQRVTTAIKNTIQRKRSNSCSLKHRLLLEDGSTPTVIQQIEVFVDQDGQAQKLTASLQDISVKIDSEQKIKNLSYCNAVTGLPNRAILQRVLEKRISNNKVGHSVVVLNINLDRLKLIYDIHGHGFTEKLLRKVAINLIRSIKNSIYFKSKNGPGRFFHDDLKKPLSITHCSANEFIVVLSEIVDVEDAASIANTINSALSRPYKIEDHELRCTVSIGISVYPQDGQAVESLLKNSSIALNHAQGLGGNCYKFYTTSMNAHAQERLTLENDLRKAVEEKQFRLLYQPKLSLRNNHIHGMEVLLRWDHPRLGLISPVKFIHILEETGLIIELGDWVLRTVCKQINNWQGNNFGLLPVAINLSAVQLQQKDFHLRFARILKEFRIDPQVIELEITESILMKDMKQSITMLKKLRMLGMQITLDDFGTGYSSLTYLKEFPVNTLKIDRSFLVNLSKDPDDDAIVKGIIALAHSMDLKVVAEGIERNSQLQYLKEACCDYGQGYLFSSPVEIGTLNRDYLKNLETHGLKIARIH